MRVGRIISLLLSFAILLSLSSCKRYKRFEYCEFGISLSKDFSQYDSGGAFHTAYSDGVTIVGITRISFVDCEDNGLLSTYSPEQLAKVYHNRLGEEKAEDIQAHGDVPYFCYTALASDGVAYFYMPSFYLTPYAYFVITFITPSIRAGEGRVEFLKYISSAYILEEYL